MFEFFYVTRKILRHYLIGKNNSCIFKLFCVFMFSDLIRTVKANHRDKVLLEKVLLEDVYLIVRQLKEDKEANILYDSNITPEML